MNQTAIQLYGILLEDLQHCQRKELGTLEEVECCFHIAERYWARLRKDVTKFKFEDVSDEIIFFKVIKPKFVAEIEYYSLCYHAELFKKDVKDNCELAKFWDRESSRFQRFINDNTEFYNYHKSFDRRNDEVYFTRAGSDFSNFPSAKVYDLDERATTSHDHLVASFIALERYADYVKKERQLLEKI